MEVVLLKGKGDFDISKVEILNTKKSAEFTPVKESDWSVTAVGNTVDITIDHDVIATADKDTDPAINEAIIVPQTLEKDTEFIKVTTTEGGTLVYKLPQGTTFESNKCYRYVLTANLTDLNVTATISEWTPADPESGDTEME